VTSLLTDGIWLPPVLVQSSVDGLNYIGTDWSLEDGWERSGVNSLSGGIEDGDGWSGSLPLKRILSTFPAKFNMGGIRHTILRGGVSGVAAVEVVDFRLRSNFPLVSWYVWC